jgi:hypothetical protein
MSILKSFFGSTWRKVELAKGDKPTKNRTQPSGTPGSTAYPSREQASSPQAGPSLLTPHTNATPPVTTFDSAPTPMFATSSVTSQGSRRLRCVIEGESIVFTVTVPYHLEVEDLKKAIKGERAMSILKGIDPNLLELWKVSIIDVK